jgi:hypothetical protein
VQDACNIVGWGFAGEVADRGQCPPGRPEGLWVDKQIDVAVAAVLPWLVKPAVKRRPLEQERLEAGVREGVQALDRRRIQQILAWNVANALDEFV